MKALLKTIAKLLLVCIIYLPVAVLWVLFVPSFRLLHYTTRKFGFRPVNRWSWLGIEVEDKG